MSAITQVRESLTPSFLRSQRNQRIAGRILVGLLILFAAILPLFYPLTATFVGNSTIALAYIVMALGLNIVVGFAGLLDLGYVAFYALGAYSMAGSARRTSSRRALRAAAWTSSPGPRPRACPAST
jgi:ABC-type branched-subunit amino acid transport system permease subunit